MTIIRHTYGKKLFVIEETLAWLALESQKTGIMPKPLQRVRDEWVKVREKPAPCAGEQTQSAEPDANAG